MVRTRNQRSPHRVQQSTVPAAPIPWPSVPAIPNTTNSQTSKNQSKRSSHSISHAPLFESQQIFNTQKHRAGYQVKNDSVAVPSFTEQHKSNQSSFKAKPADPRNLTFALVIIIILLVFIFYVLI